MEQFGFTDISIRKTYIKKNPALPDSPRPSDAVYGYLPFREVRILHGVLFAL